MTYLDTSNQNDKVLPGNLSSQGWEMGWGAIRINDNFVVVVVVLFFFVESFLDSPSPLVLYFSGFII